MSLLSACSFQQYQTKPIQPLENIARFSHKDPASPAFQVFLINSGYSAQGLPIVQWGLDELTYCALFFHPSLDVARAQWYAAQSAQASAGERALPNFNANIARSNDPDPAKKPFALGFSLDLPLETANKRGIRIENAQHLSQIAKLEIAQTAWQLREGIAQTLTELQFNQAELQLLTVESLLRKEIVNLFKKRVSLGASSNIELSNANLLLQNVNTALADAQQKKLVLMAKLASNIGLPLAQVEKMSIRDDNEANILEPPNTELQSTALLNRLDIRIALVRYAAAESKLKLEIAKQYPDLVISPSTAYEFGDTVWSLGLSGLMTLLNKNKVGIAETSHLREVEAAQFEALQNKVILDANQTLAEFSQAKSAWQQQKILLAQQQTNTQRMQAKFNAGEIDRLEMAYAKLENINAEKNLALADFQRNKAFDQLENTLQKPLRNSTFAATDTQIKIEGEK